MKLIDRVGQEFNNLIIKDVFYKKLHNRNLAYCECNCKCGNSISVLKDHLLSGHTKSCGCLDKSIKIDSILALKKIGEIEILSYHETNKNGNIFKCKDKYGDIRYISAASLKRKDHKRTINKHNLSKTRLYSTYLNMKSRCYYKKNPRYKDYGKKGIEVCDEWMQSFMDFYKWSLDNNYQKDLTIDRIDNSGDYEPNNCRWLSNAKQQLNKTNNNLITIKNQKKTLAEWCRIIDIKRRTVYRRVEKGMSWEEALITPLKFRNAPSL